MTAGWRITASGGPSVRTSPKLSTTVRSARLITNAVRKILDEKLGVRNTCAHPSDVEVHRTKVINFIEDLVDNVIVKYSKV